MEKRTERLLVAAMTFGGAVLIYVQFGNAFIAGSTILSGLLILLVSYREEQ